MNITIDITGEIPAIGHDDAELQKKIFLLAEMARSEWIRLAQSRLLSSSADYIAGIQTVEVKGNWAAVHLVGWLPNQIENGMAPYDMKPGLLAGPHAKTTKSGKRMNIVPFRHGTPGSTGRNVGTPMPITSGKTKSFVYTAAKALVASSGDRGTMTKWGGKTGDFGGYGIRTMLPVKDGRPGAYTWKSSPYAAMYKISKTYGKAVQNQYVTFRAVSENSDPNSWWHPGIKASHFALQVSNYIRVQIERI